MGYFETVCEMPSLQNRERTGVPVRAARGSVLSVAVQNSN